MRSEDNPEGDIEVELTGLKPGEKLHEELLVSGDVTGTDHRKIMPRGREWFVPMAQPKVACWWIEAGVIPTLEEGKDRLAFLLQNGESEYAFGYRHPEFSVRR